MLFDMNQISIIEQIATDLGVPRNTIAQWRVRKRVPYHRRLEMVREAQSRGVVLEDRVFDEFRTEVEPCQRAGESPA